MSVERLAAAIVAYGQLMNPEASVEATGMPTEAMLQTVQNAIMMGHPEMVRAVALVETIVSAYMGTTALDMSITARELINLVSHDNVAKQFQLEVPDGPGKGAWEVIVRRHHPVSYDRRNSLLGGAAAPSKLIILRP